MTTITDTKHRIERENLTAPFGFKGAYCTELWQSIVRLQAASGESAVGLGVQSVLWSDPDVFFACGETRGNELMREVTVFALTEARKLSFDTPLELMDQLVPLSHEFAQKITSRPDLRLTFTLNALVPVDLAAWLICARERGSEAFTDMIPEEYRKALAHRHEAVAAVPVVSYGMDRKGLDELIAAGSRVLKIKVGSDPAGDKDPEKMLEWDKQRLSEIHDVCRGHADKAPLYYLDANGRYDSKERLLRLLDHADRIGALDRIALFEEPFPEHEKIDVADIPVIFAADESVHGEADATERIDLGYKALALKPVAKTLSISLKVAEIARRRGVSCFCADLTVNPLLVEWNKNLAARLAPIPGFDIGIVETNGAQNYRRWEEMKTYHPVNGASWTVARQGVFRLDTDFYTTSGGIFGISEHYESFDS